MAWKRYPKYQKKIKTYKDYTHFSFSNIAKKKEQLENKKEKLDKKLIEVSFFERKIIHFREGLDNRLKSRIDTLYDLKDSYVKVLEDEKTGFFERMLGDEKYDDRAKNKFQSIKTQMKNILKECKSTATKIAQQELGKIPTFNFVWENKIKGDLEYNINFLNSEINRYDLKIEDIDNENFLTNSKYSSYAFTIKRNNPNSFLEDSLDYCKFVKDRITSDLNTIRADLKPVVSAYQIIEKKEQKEKEKIKRANEKADKFKAQAYAFQEKTRDLSEEIKKEISDQQNIFPVCPYCEQTLGLEPHADHIYPVTLGGQATPENMVYVCAKCNLSKGALTLREFINKRSLNRDRVENNLSLLGKKF